MKTAVSATGPHTTASVDLRFGRAQCFMVHDSETDSWQTLENSVNLAAAQGAGIQTAQNLANAGVEAVITGHCGPKAFRVLSSGGIRVYIAQPCTVAEAVEALNEGSLAVAAAPDVEGHWQ